MSDQVHAAKGSLYRMGRGSKVGIGVAALALFAVAWFALASTWASVPPDMIMLHYTGGPLQGTHFKEVIQPGTGVQFLGLRENPYMLPATQRNYIVSKDPNIGDRGTVDFISAPSNDNVPFTFEAAVYFKLNTNPDVLRQFFEQICLHDECWNLEKGGGWDKMLEQYLRPQLENALRLEVGKHDREDLYHNPDTLVAINTAVGKSLKNIVNANIGGEYFCGPDSSSSSCNDFGVVVKNPTPPDNVVAEYGNTAAAQQHVVTAQNDAAAKNAAAKGDADAQNTRASAQPLTQAQIDYIQAQAQQACASNPVAGACTMIVTPGTSGVNVNVGK